MATPIIVADYEGQLATAIAVGGTSFTLSSVLDDDGVALPSGTYYFTIDNWASNKEYLLGQLSGSSVTGVYSVSRQGVETSGAARAHRVGASVIITDFATYKKYVDGTAIAGAPNAGAATIGITKLSTAPASPTNPIAVGDNDTRVPSQGENDALAGSAGTPSSTNTYLTQLGGSAGGVDQSQTTQNATSAVGQADSSGNRNKLAQSFVAGKGIIRSVTLHKAANTGTFSGTVTVSIQADSSGSPSGVALATKTVTNALYNAYATGANLFIFSSELAVTIGNTYWIVIETSTSDSSNCPNLGTNSAGGYAPGSVKYKNTTDGWVAVATIDLYFKVNQGFGGRALFGDSTGLVPAEIRGEPAKVGTVTATTTGAAVAHGLGKVPSRIYAQYAEGGSTFMAYSHGAYDVASNAYIVTGCHYNEGTSGGTINAADAVAYTNNALSAKVTLTVDENAVIFTSSSGSQPVTYQIIA